MSSWVILAAHRARSHHYDKHNREEATGTRGSHIRHIPIDNLDRRCVNYLDCSHCMDQDPVNRPARCSGAVLRAFVATWSRLGVNLARSFRLQSPCRGRFRTVDRTGQLRETFLDRIEVFKIVKRRVRAAVFRPRNRCHLFRATGITAYLEYCGVTKKGRAVTTHESPQATKLYGRTRDLIALD
jgi:hypothetical protein